MCPGQTVRLRGQSVGGRGHLSNVVLHEQRERERWGKSCRNHLVSVMKEAWRRKASMLRLAEHKQGTGVSP